MPNESSTDPPTVADPVRSDTARVFGAYCHYVRLSKYISWEGVESEFARTPEWVSALERGEFVPTLNMALELDSQLGLTPDEGLLALLVELELEPYGERATSMRQLYNLPSYEPAPDTLGKSASLGESSSSIGTIIRDRDRLLVTAPFVLFSTILGSQIGLALWADHRLSDAALPLAAGLASIGLAAITLLLTSAEWTLRTFSRAVRGHKACHRFKLVAKRRELSGLRPTFESCWYQERESQHLLASERVNAIEWTLKTDLSERYYALLWINLFVSAFIFDRRGADGRHIVHVVCLAVLAVFAVIARRSASISSKFAETSLSVGLGYMPNNPAPTNVDGATTSPS